DFANNLSLMENSNFFAFWEGDETPYQKYTNANYVKEALYSGTDTDVTFDMYQQYREDYIDSSQKFLNGPYEDSILKTISDSATRDFVVSLFTTARDQFKQMLEIRETVSARVKDSLSIIGVDATGMTDTGLITFQEEYPNVGMYSAIANQLLSGEFLDDAPWYVSFLIALVLSLVTGFFVKRLDVGKSIVLGLCAMIFTAAVLVSFFIITKRYVGAAVPFASVTLTFLSLTGLNFFTTVREKSFIRSAFSRYLAPEVIEQIISDPSKLNLGGDKREMTAIFTDIRSFSTISESLKDPKMLVDLLNHYLTRMSNIILENQGTVDKYEGDAIIAFFGAPIHYPDHAVRTCRSAVLMKKAEKEINREAISQGLITQAVIDLLVTRGITTAGEDPIYTRIGINTGDMVVGNMGTSDKMNYTIMGDAVNLAARLEGVNKQYNTGGILISEYTRAQIGDEFLLRSLDRVRVVGLNTPIRLYELLDIQAQAQPQTTEMTIEWEKMIQLYEQQNFREAGGILKNILNENPRDGTARVFLTRCTGFLKNPPSPDWDGVNNLSQK
ncbi:MAG: adenylate/guanylate cyclase domain-containing protein, partial [Treponema sp.]|nr:adenylate/guanylate cyclase domain-containing protein [Treponema sp.]